ncbi:MAG: hypothetical protein KatS3mg027_1998 [Bacteroidia bacterium]|nr:MAG: hypothetical protein KatS3mg027_1998 [Bacteroidia bacterium]
MLINYSNHPSNLWPEEQKKAAIHQFHQIIDEPFPYINPHDPIDEIKKLAFSEFNKIHNKYNHSPYAMHIMGEHTYIFLLIQIFLKNHVPCFASTTHRIVTEKNNIKQSTFQFIQFRPYILIDS